MKLEEALAWLRGERSHANTIGCGDCTSPGDGVVKVAKADAASTEQAYWIAKAHDALPLELHR